MNTTNHGVKKTYPVILMKMDEVKSVKFNDFYHKDKTLSS